MGCIIIAALLGAPRLAIVFFALFRHGWLASAYESNLWPVLGFFFLPWTTLGFAVGINNIGPVGAMDALGWAVTALGFALDMGLVGGGARARRKRA
jgi:cytochrome b561